jgi:long-chain acyl-CoA synthetase
MCKLVRPSIEKPWLKFFSEEAREASMPKNTIYRHLRENNENRRSDTALNYFGRKISYGTLLDEADRCAGAFKAAGIGKGDIVAAATVTIPEMVYALYGLNKIGAAPLVIDPRTSASGVMDFIKESGSKIFIVIDLFYEALKDAIFESGVEKIVVISADTSLPSSIRFLKQFKMPAPKIATSDKVMTWTQFSATGEGIKTETVEYGENDLAAVTLTGGTTGAPKGVMLSNDGFNAIAFDFKHCGVSYDRGQRFLNIIPMFSSYGIVSSLHMPLSLGLEVVVIPKFNADKVGYYVKKYRPEHTLLVPAHYEKLMNSKEMSKGFNLSFFRTAGSGGDTMNAGLEAKLNKFLESRGCRFPLSQGYGMSEVSSAASCCCNGNFKSLSVGYPLLTTNIAIFEPGTQKELDYGEEGEICISGPSIMLGYLNNKAETDKVMRRHDDGTVWVHSGDIGHMDSDGFVYIKGRIKRMITLFNGHKIFPTHIESVLGRHSGVSSCAVVGVNDTQHAQGQLTLAVIETKETSLEKRTAIKNELYEMCRQELEGSAKPYDIIFVDSMPHTGMGKIDYLKLADDYNNENKEETEAV